MSTEILINDWIKNTFKALTRKKLSQTLHIDPILFWAVLALASLGLIILYSAGNADPSLVVKQITHFGLGLLAMFILAQISPARYKRLACSLFVVTLILLVGILILGHIGKGAQRWLTVGSLRFQPSELMKLVLPMMLAWYLHDKPQPLSKKHLLTLTVLTIIPMGLIAKQPDLSTAILIGSIGISMAFLAGMHWRFFSTIMLCVAALAPVAWHFMYDYQRQRLLTFMDPERDPLNKGYHLIQSKIAIGSGGLFGKGWLEGTQSHLQFLPEHTTDFIFSVAGEEFGLMGTTVLLATYLIIVFRGLYISSQGQETFTRLLAGSLILTFFFSFFVNIGMVMGLLPVMGVPLPLVSYGGTSLITMMAWFGILMSIQTHRKLLST